MTTMRALRVTVMAAMACGLSACSAEGPPGDASGSVAEAVEGACPASPATTNCNFSGGAAPDGQAGGPDPQGQELNSEPDMREMDAATKGAADAADMANRELNGLKDAIANAGRGLTPGEQSMMDKIEHDRIEASGLGARVASFTKSMLSNPQGFRQGDVDLVTKGQNRVAGQLDTLGENARNLADAISGPGTLLQRDRRQFFAAADRFHRAVGALYDLLVPTAEASSRKVTNTIHAPTAALADSSVYRVENYAEECDVNGSGRSFQATAAYVDQKTVSRNCKYGTKMKGVRYVIGQCLNRGSFSTMVHMDVLQCRVPIKSMKR